MGVTQKVGSLGEELVVRFLVRKGYKILDRNFRRPWGELDIVATRKERIHFVEVKSVSDMKGDVSDETTWQFDVATVYVNEGQKKAKINLMEEIIL